MYLNIYLSFNILQLLCFRMLQSYIFVFLFSWITFSCMYTIQIKCIPLTLYKYTITYDSRWYTMFMEWFVYFLYPSNGDGLENTIIIGPFPKINLSWELNEHIKCRSRCITQSHWYCLLSVNQTTKWLQLRQRIRCTCFQLLKF